MNNLRSVNITEVTPLGHLIQSGNYPAAFNSHTKASSTRPGHLSMREDKYKNQRITTIQKDFPKKKNENQQCFAMDGSKMGSKLS
jgi:hypothetical protein